MEVLIHKILKVKDIMRYTKQNEIYLKLISNYKKKIRTSQMLDERYKWELTAKYKNRPDVNAADWVKEIKEVDYSNLIYPLAVGVIKELSETFTDKTRGLFVMLFDESIDLEERIKKFSNTSSVLFDKMKQGKKGFQDERAIATYLTYHNPEKYTFFKSSFYQKLCKIIGIKLNNLYSSK